MTMDGRRIALRLSALIGVAVAVTLIEGAPVRLPGVALGSTVLLHAERAAALFAIGVAIISVLAQARKGRLPTQPSTSGIAYEAEHTRETTTALAELQHEVDRHQTALDQVAEALDVLRAKA